MGLPHRNYFLRDFRLCVDRPRGSPFGSEDAPAFATAPEAEPSDFDGEAVLSELAPELVPVALFPGEPFPSVLDSEEEDAWLADFLA